MEIDELARLLEWIEREIRAKRIVKLYSALSQILQQNTNTQPLQPFADQTAALATALREVDFSDLSQEQIEFLRRLNLRQNIGPEGALRVEEITRSALDIATAASALQSMLDEVQSGVQKSDELRGGLKGLIGDHVELNPNDVIVRVAFKGEVAIENVVDFRDQADDWYDIGRGLAVASGCAPEDIRVVGARTGSVIIEFAVVVGAARVVAGVLLKCLEIADKTMDVRKKAEEIRGLKLQNDALERAATAIDAEADNIKQQAVETVATETVARLPPALANGESILIVGKAVRTLVFFIENGGHVDCVIPPQVSQEGGAEPIEAPELAELRGRMKEIRVLEAKLRLLSPPTTNQQ